MLPEGRRLQYRDLQQTKDILEVSLLDFCWLMGAPAVNWSYNNPQTGQKEINDPVTTILARFYAENPDYNLLPKMPSASTLYELLKKPYERITGQELSWRRFGILFGVSHYSSHRWSKGGPLNPKPQRLFLLLYLAVQREGDEALRKYLRLLDVEARVRGFPNGLNDVLSAGTWGKYSALRPGRKKAAGTKKKKSATARSKSKKG